MGLFYIKPDAHFSECNICEIEVSRVGKNSKTFIMTLKGKHVDECKRYKEEKAAKLDTYEATDQQEEQEAIV